MREIRWPISSIMGEYELSGWLSSCIICLSKLLFTCIPSPHDSSLRLSDCVWCSCIRHTWQGREAFDWCGWMIDRDIWACDQPMIKWPSCQPCCVWISTSVCLRHAEVALDSCRKPNCPLFCLWPSCTTNVEYPPFRLNIQHADQQENRSQS